MKCGPATMWCIVLIWHRCKTVPGAHCCHLSAIECCNVLQIRQYQMAFLSLHVWVFSCLKL